MQICAMETGKENDNGPVGLLDTSSGWGGLAGCLGGQLLPWGLASCALAGCLLGTCHLCLTLCLIALARICFVDFDFSDEILCVV